MRERFNGSQKVQGLSRPVPESNGHSSDRLPKSVRKQMVLLGVRSLNEAQGMVVFGGK